VSKALGLHIATETARRSLKALPGIERFLRSRSGQALRHWLALHLEKRESFTFTQFLRLPSQYDALTGPVLELLGGPERTEPLRVVVVGCSTGAEPYTISSVLQHRVPDLPFMIDALDYDEKVLEIAARGTYPRPTVINNRFMSDTFVSETFDQLSDRFVVKRDVAERVRFRRCDLFDPGFATATGSADIVYAQNILCNMPRGDARRAFDNICALLKPVGVLFIDGMDLDMRARLTRVYDLQPLNYELERIHNEARVIRGERYPWYATGLEPFNDRRKDLARRYATVFYRGVLK
jgi:chemotaxis methyl-accepting protein methylase